MDDLTLQIGQLDDVVIDHPDHADASSSQIQRRWRPQPASTDDQHAGSGEPLLPHGTDSGKHEVAGVTRCRCIDRVGRLAPLGAPLSEPTGERRHSAITHVLQRLGGQRRTVPCGAHQHDFGVAVRSDALDRIRKRAHWNQYRPGNRAGDALLWFPNVDDQGRIRHSGAEVGR